MGYKMGNNKPNLISLIDKSITFPDQPVYQEILVDSKIRELQRKFSPSNQIIIIKGPSGSGKTNQLRQFSIHNPSSVFSYFLSDNYWTYRQSAFLRSICEQMEGALKISADKRVDWGSFKVDNEQLKQHFELLNQKIIDLSKHEKRVFYFVIDGLEWAYQGNQGERIIDLLPPLIHSCGVYFLGSINSSFGNELSFDYSSEEPHYFSLVETEKYLAELNPTSEEVKKIQELSGGLPGILFTMKSLCERGKATIASIIDKSADLDTLVEFQWKKSLGDFPEDKKIILALIAYSLVPLKDAIISEILNIELDEIRSVISKTGLIRHFGDNYYSFYPELHKTIAQKRLSNLRSQTISLFSRYYEKRPNSLSSKELLPEYYRLEENYEGIQKLLEPEFVIAGILENNNFILAKRDLGNAIELAKKKNDISAMRFGMSISQIRSLSDELIGSSEVQALVAMKKFDAALELAYAAKLIASKVRLLSFIYLAMEKEGTTVSRHALIELEHMVNSLDFNTLEPQQILDISTELFPLMPDQATSLIEKAKLKESERSSFELFALVTSLKFNDPECEDLLNKIENRELQEFALANSPWLSKLSASEVIKRGLDTKQIKAKEYLFRNWCLQNRQNSEVHLVMGAALDAIIQSNYPIPLRSLRQLSEPLKYCNLEYRKLLIYRFEIPEFEGLKSPIEERVRLELNLVEAMNDLDPIEASRRFTDVYGLVRDAQLDTDVSCYCLTRLLISLDKIELENKNNIFASIKKHLEDEFIRLLDTSADQYEVAKGVLRVLPIVDYELALSFSDMLNSVIRRDLGIRDVLIAYVRQEAKPIVEGLIDTGLEKITDYRIKDLTILKVVETAMDYDKLLSGSIRDYLIKMTLRIQDPIIYCKSLSYILSQMKLKDDPALFKDLFARLINSWEQIDIVWMRVEAAFDLSRFLARGGITCAEELYDRAKALRNSSSLASQSIGAMYYETLWLAAKAVGSLNLTTQSSIECWDTLIQKIDLIPSVVLRSMLLAQLAITRLKCGDKGSFDTLVQNRILVDLQTMPASDLTNKLVSNVALCLFEYSPGEAKRWIDKLPYALKNFTWGDVAARIIFDAKLFDELDFESLDASIDLASGNKVLQVLELIQRDSTFSSIGNLFVNAIKNKNSKLSEPQKLDFLYKLEAITSAKLPDLLNIQHYGYKILLESQIVVAIKIVAKKTWNIIRSKYHLMPKRLAEEIREIKNIADRVLVLALVAKEFRDCEYDLANELMNEAYELSSQIPNLRDRAGRLETIAEGFSKLHKTDRAFEAIMLANNIALSVDGVARDTILASVIQTAHQIDKEKAVQISEKIEDPSIRYKLNTILKADELSKAPHKLQAQFSSWIDMNGVMKNAAMKMSKSISSGRGVTYSDNIIVEWLSATKNLDFDASQEIVNWAVEAVLRHATESAVNGIATKIINSLMWNSELLYAIGYHLSSLTAIPESAKKGFHGLSTNKKFFRGGERFQAVEYVANWLKANAQEFVKICDPYFDCEQLWVLKNIPENIQVNIICTGIKFGLPPKEKDLIESPIKNKEKKESEKRRLKDLMNEGWKEISDQIPPSTFVVVHGTVYDTNESDEIHDRYIITKNGGLAIGTSLNGFGNKEFFISVMVMDDVRYVCEKYIDPKLKIQDFFTKIIYFELGD